MEKINPLEYLPELYLKAGGFTERFLSIFTDIYSGIEEKIDVSDRLYDPKLCPEEFIEWLGEWISAENMRLFPDNKKRDYLLAIPRLSSHRGTLCGLKELLELYCGTKVFVVEHYHVKRYFSYCKDLERLYSGGRFTVWILCSPAKCKTDALEKIAESQLPANITAKIKVLSNITELNNYCYLGVNSVIAGTSRGALDGKCALNYVHLGGERK
ncbi:MAG: hypothetical protein J1F04_07465 [Oscillospiraceae bacterium]|nr:hypothetical protein [Oscillospiraceae bacterium]